MQCEYLPSQLVSIRSMNTGRSGLEMDKMDSYINEFEIIPSFFYFYFFCSLGFTYGKDLRMHSILLCDRFKGSKVHVSMCSHQIFNQGRCRCRVSLHGGIQLPGQKRYV